MALDDIFKGGNLATGLAVGVGMAVAAPLVTPLLRPVAKTLIKAGINAYDQGRVAFAEVNERTSDMIAEARAEMEEEHRAEAHERDRHGKSAPASATQEEAATANS